MASNDPNQDDLYQRIVADTTGQSAGVGPANASQFHPGQMNGGKAAPGVNGVNGASPMQTASINGVAGIQMAGMGSALDASGHGVTVTMPGAGGHVLTVFLAGMTGAGLGGAASGSWRGAGIGAAGNLALVGLVNAIFGKGFTGVGGRVAYGIVGALGMSAAAWLMVRRRRGR